MQSSATGYGLRQHTAIQYLYNGLWLSPTLLYIVVVALGDDRKNDYNSKIIDVWWLGFADLT